MVVMAMEAREGEGGGTWAGHEVVVDSQAAGTGLPRRLLQVRSAGREVRRGEAKRSEAR